ncbi:MAG: carbohydrate deacetylase [Bacillota bacterium]
MLQLIINADDLGLTPGCNAGILQALTEGIVTDTTLMINTEFTDDAVKGLKARGINRVGLHLNLTCGTPLLPAAEVPSLVDDAGRFNRKIAVAAPNMRQAEVERELGAQVEKFLGTGLGLTHLDSHHHAHSYPGIREAAIGLARKLGVPLRQTGEELRRQIVAAGVASTDFFAVNFYEQGVSLENLQAIIASHRQGTLEIMCHPAVPEELIYRISSYNSWRERELALLTSREMTDFLKEKGVRLIGFDALPRD